MYICLLYSIIIHYKMIITVLCIGNMVIFSKNKKMLVDLQVSSKRYVINKQLFAEQHIILQLNNI